MATIRRERKVLGQPVKVDPNSPIGQPVKVDPNSPIGQVILEHGDYDIEQFEAEIKDALPDRLPLP